MAHSNIKTGILLTAFALSSCATIVEEVVSPLVSTDISQGVNHAKPSVLKASQNKQKTKEEAKLKAAGKCPTCRGIGRTPDGQYICETCKGTGKYVETNNKQE